MLAPIKLEKRFIEWNKKWGAPFEKMFAYQKNNTTRYYEYPWAFYATKIKKGMKVIELGAGLSGFQFVLSKENLEVTNIDPGWKHEKKEWPTNKKSIQKLNKKFKTKIKLKNCTIAEAEIESNSQDRIYSISMIEHLSETEAKKTIKEVERVLKVGGKLVMTIDLFPHLIPFTKRKKCKWGQNIPISNILEKSGLKLSQGKKSELYGFKEFNEKKILKNLDKYFIGRYPALIQTIILTKIK